MQDGARQTFRSVLYSACVQRFQINDFSHTHARPGDSPRRPPRVVGRESQVTYNRIKVMIETDERCFKGYIYKPDKGEDFRLSDHLNSYEKQFVCLSDVEINDRGIYHRVGDKRDFVAVALSAITYLVPLEEG